MSLVDYGSSGEEDNVEKKDEEFIKPTLKGEELKSSKIKNKQQVIFTVPINSSNLKQPKIDIEDDERLETTQITALLIYRPKKKLQTGLGTLSFLPAPKHSDSSTVKIDTNNKKPNRNPTSSTSISSKHLETSFSSNHKEEEEDHLKSIISEVNLYYLNISIFLIIIKT